ncbi:MAG TPA: hypothetical protein VLD16_05295 [Gaiellaceae bacterium]|nr:hypothetical protein [Gaiellaceae bacterium]
MIGRCLLIAAVVATVAACGAQSSGGASDGGLYGTVRISPATPVCVSGRPCSRPARGFKLLFSRGGHTVTATTDGRGRYRVHLSAGRYLVRAAAASRNASPKAGLQPRAVSVPGTGFARRNFVYDSGIR